MKTPRRFALAFLCVLTSAATLFAPIGSLIACPCVAPKPVQAQEQPAPTGCEKHCCDDTHGGACCCGESAPANPCRSMAECGCSTPSDSVPPPADAAVPSVDFALALNQLEGLSAGRPTFASAFRSAALTPFADDLLVALARLNC